MQNNQFNPDVRLIAYVWKNGEVTLEPPQLLVPLHHYLVNLDTCEPANKDPMMLTPLQAAEINHDLRCHQHIEFGWMQVGHA